ncbi:hypothetical protein [Marinobacter vulgaris]|uniref:hypothetical protein n=1 Tax=Marinobacter vulgaris TaxID=1928331 RepID=UPI001D0D9FD5|nr:hypothetical protein [Marinobacter vulgaris]
MAEQEKSWTWHLLNWRIAAKEFAISGAEHNAWIRDQQFPLFVKELLLSRWQQELRLAMTLTGVTRVADIGTDQLDKSHKPEFPKAGEQ